MRGKTIVITVVAVLCLVGSLFALYYQVITPMLTAPANQAKLYFADAEAMQVVPELRELQDKPTAKILIQELIKGPKNPNLWPTLPPNTQLRSVEIVGRTAVVNLSLEAMQEHPGGSAAELMLVYSVVATLTELPQVENVQFLIEGQVYESIWGHMDTTVPISPDDNFIAR